MSNVRSEPMPKAVGSTDELGGSSNEGTNGSGPRGTHGCACLDRDSVQCAAIRYGMDHYGEACECLCHQWDDDDE